MALRVIQLQRFAKLRILVTTFNRFDKLSLLDKTTRTTPDAMTMTVNRGFRETKMIKTRKTIFPKRVRDVTKRSSTRRPQQLIGGKVDRSRMQLPYDDDDITITGTGDDVDELDYLAHSVSTYGSKHSAFEAEREKTKELVKLNSFVKAKIVGKQHFKEPKKPNLLTWGCKEQIRSLHQKDPEEWSIHELAKRFPVSELSISKILKSRVRLHRVADIKEHDLFVKRNWQNLYDSLVANSKSITECDDSVKDILANIGSGENLFNVFPLEDGTIQKQLLNIPRRRKLGTFSSMVKDEIKRKELEIKALQLKHQEELDRLRNTILNVKKIVADSEVDSQRAGKTETQSKQEPILKKGKKSYKDNQVPFRVSVSHGGEKVVDGLVYDENGDFLYRIS